MNKKVEYAWAAGLFDGEGSIIISNPKDRPNPRICFSLSMTCEKSVKAFHKIVDVGSVRELKRYRNTKFKPQWRWSVESSPKIVIVIQKIGPYLITKKDKLNTALKNWHKYFDIEKSRNWKNILAGVKEVMPHVIE